MKIFVIIFATIGIFALTISLSISSLVLALDNTNVGRAIKDYILSKIVKENKDE